MQRREGPELSPLSIILIDSESYISLSVRPSIFFRLPNLHAVIVEIFGVNFTPQVRSKSLSTLPKFANRMAAINMR